MQSPAPTTMFQDLGAASARAKRAEILSSVTRSRNGIIRGGAVRKRRGVARIGQVSTTSSAPSGAEEQKVPDEARSRKASGAYGSYQSDEQKPGRICEENGRPNEDQITSISTAANTEATPSKPGFQAVSGNDQRVSRKASLAAEGAAVSRRLSHQMPSISTAAASSPASASDAEATPSKPGFQAVSGNDQRVSRKASLAAEGAAVSRRLSHQISVGDIMCKPSDAVNPPSIMSTDTLIQNFSTRGGYFRASNVRDNFPEKVGDHEMIAESVSVFSSSTVGDEGNWKDKSRSNLAILSPPSPSDIDDGKKGDLKSSAVVEEKKPFKQNEQKNYSEADCEKAHPLVGAFHTSASQDPAIDKTSWVEDELFDSYRTTGVIEAGLDQDEIRVCQSESYGAYHFINDESEASGDLLISGMKHDDELDMTEAAREDWNEYSCQSDTPLSIDDTTQYLEETDRKFAADAAFTSPEDFDDPRKRGFALSRQDLQNLFIGVLLIVVTIVGISGVFFTKGGRVSTISDTGTIMNSKRVNHYESILKEVMERTTTPIGILRDDSTPQAKGLDWIVQFEENQEIENLIQRYALLTLFYSLGGSATSLGWGEATSDDKCTWIGIRCSEGSKGSVTSLDLAGKDLVGSVATEIGLLADLENINLAENMLSGDIPSTIFGLSRLEYLNVEKNRFGPTLPDGIRKLGKIKFLSLGQNSFTGTIPSSLGSLPLSTLKLYDNSFEGEIPQSFKNLTEVRNLSIHTNAGLSGSIFDYALRMPSLEILDCSNNHLSGTVPTDIGNLTSLSKSTFYSILISM